MALTSVLILYSPFNYIFKGFMKVAILIFTFFLISCNSNDPKTDIDTVPDEDSVAVIDSDTQDADIPVSDPDIV